MTQGDDSEEQLQAMRSVDVNLPLNAAPPATPAEIFHVETQLDPETQKEVVLWDDILQAFRNVVQVRNKSRVVPFLKGKDLRILEPRRIAAIRNTVLDVVVDRPLVDKGVTPFQVQQLALRPAPPQNDDSTIKFEIASQNTTLTPTATSSLSATPSPAAPSTAYSIVRRDPVYGLVETAMENYTHIERPLAFPSARGPQAVRDNQACTVKDPLFPSPPNSDNEAQQRAPQSAIVSMEIQWARMTISASEGDTDAQVTLGDSKRDVQDYQAAMDWYLKAAEQGDAAGQQRVGGLYDEGFGVPQDYSAAMYWYLKAAEQGHVVAQHSIGVLYSFGRGVPQDYGQAMDWYLKAADQGHAGSQYSIGQLYYFGRGVPKDTIEAMDWYLKAASQGYAPAQQNIGILYRHGRSVQQDYRQAMDWFLKAANQGDAHSQNNIGHLYQYGEGVPQDYTKAAEWFQKAADQGDAEAKRNLRILSDEQAACLEDEYAMYEYDV